MARLNIPIPHFQGEELDFMIKEPEKNAQVQPNASTQIKPRAESPGSSIEKMYWRFHGSFFGSIAYLWSVYALGEKEARSIKRSDFIEMYK